MDSAIELKEEFVRLHKVVREGLEAFVVVGDALRDIRDKKLFVAAGHKSFKDYCEAEFDFSYRRGLQMIDAAEIAKEHVVTNERAARAVQSVPKEHREEVVKRANERMDEPTSSMIEDMAQEVLREKAPPEQAPPLSVKFDEIQQLLRDAGRRLNELGATPAGVFLPLTHIKADLKNAHDSVRLSVPTHRCYVCSGDGCDVCRGLGWIPTDMFDRRPKEFN
mgnify:CR=1 FL=1